MTVRHLLSYSILVALAWLVNWPGRLNPDSQDMLQQARDINKLGDWHPPVVTWLWSLPTPVLGQPAGALLIQALLLFAYPALVLLAPSPMKGWGAKYIAYTIGCGLFLLALIAATGSVIKDQTLVGFILCFLATIHLLEQPSSRTTGTAVLCITFAILILVVRPTNFVILGVASACWVVINVQDRRALTSTLIAIALACAVALPLTQFINRTLLGAGDRLTERSLMIFDVAGISTGIQQNLFADLRDWPADQMPRPWECYTPRAWDPFAWGACQQYAKTVAERIQRDGKADVVRWWMGAIVSHPVAYLQHRLSHVGEVLGSPDPTVEPTRTPRAMNVSDGERDAAGFQTWKPAVAYSPFSAVADIVFSRIAFALAFLACFGLLSYAWLRRRAANRADSVIVMAAAIGVGNVLMLFPFGVAADGRYLFPTLVCGVVGMLRFLRLSLIKEVNAASLARAS